MSSKLVESGEQIKMGTDRDFFHRACSRLASHISPSLGLKLARGTQPTRAVRKTRENRGPPLIQVSNCDQHCRGNEQKKSRPLGRENQGEIIYARRTKFNAIVTS
jgi:hypothetical protein